MEVFDTAALAGLLRELDAGEHRELEKAAASLARRTQDAVLVEQMAGDGFAGPLYEMWLIEIVAYALPVLRSMLRRGVIFQYCAHRGRPVGCSGEDRDFLAEHQDERWGLVGETITRAIPVFRRTALLERGWTVEGGAALMTFFVGQCLHQFPNVFRRWQAERMRWRRAQGYGVDAEDLGTPAWGRPEGDPDDVVVSRQYTLGVLAGLPDSVREAAARHVLVDETYAEVADAMGWDSDRAVEGKFYRERQKMKKRKEGRRNS